MFKEEDLRPNFHTISIRVHDKTYLMLNELAAQYDISVTKLVHDTVILRTAIESLSRSYYLRDGDKDLDFPFDI